MTRTTRGAALLLVFMSAALGAGCKKEKMSLVLVQLKLAVDVPDATGLKSVTLKATPGPTQTYDEVSTLTAADPGITLGLYLPESVTGGVTIVATATRASGCVGFRGTGDVTVDAPGVTRSVGITMSPDVACPPDGGMAGSGGGGGAAGSGSAGTGGAAGRGGASGSSGAGTGGGAAGTGGSAGTGGGAAGTGGRGGTAGGAAGTGGGAAGIGGRGGAGGTAGGTGGMAGYPSIAACRTFAHAGGSACPNVQVKAVAISPNGQLVATGGDDERVQIWNFDGRTLTKTTTVLTMFTGSGLAFSPDGTRLIYTSHTTVKTYTVAGWAAGTPLQNDGSNNDLVTAAFTPNGQRVVSVDALGSAGGDVFAHEVGGNGLPALTAHIIRQPASMAVSKVAASDGSVGIVVGTYPGISPASNPAIVAVLALGATAFTAPTMLSPSHPDSAVFAVRFSSDGSLVAMGDDYGIVRSWAYPITSMTPVGSDITFAGGDVINDIAFSPNGMYQAVGGAFQVAQLSIYNVATHAEVDRTTPASDINTVVFSPSGAAIIAGEYECSAVLVCN